MTQHELVKCPHCESTSIFIHQEDDLCLCGECGEAWERATKAQPQWISVSERMPENEGTYFCLGHNGTPFVCLLRNKKYEGYVWLRNTGTRVVDGITHWMPITPAPVQAKDGE